MRLGVSTWCFRNEPVFQALERISSLGVQYVELFANTFHLDPRVGKTDVRELASLLKDGNLTAVSLHMPFAGIPGNRSESFVLNAWLGLVEECLPIVAGLRIPAVVIHPQFRTSERAGPSAILETVGVVLEDLLPKVRDIGSRVLLENLPSFMFSGFWESRHFREWFGRVNQPEIGMCFDVSHCIGSGLDVFEEIRSCLSWVREIHMSDNRMRSGVDLHLPVQRGSTDWRSFLALLRDAGFDGDLILEIDGGNDAQETVRGSITMIRGLLEDLPGRR
ncbi:MAG: sugar phosphate isomerase/epimerase [Thermodesulfobacteriota bacterium]